MKHDPGAFALAALLFIVIVLTAHRVDLALATVAAISVIALGAERPRRA